MSKISEIRGLGYIGVEASDLPAWGEYLTGALGIPFAATLDDGTKIVRVDEYERRILLHPGSADDVVYVGWEGYSAGDVEALAERLTKAGVAVREGDKATCAVRNAEALIQFEDPNGLPTEVAAGLRTTSEPVPKGKVEGAFVTGSAGLGHFAIVAQSYSETLEFYTKLLRFRVTDHVLMPYVSGPPGMCFLHVNQRHHSLVFGEYENYAPLFEIAPILAKKRIHHFLLEINNPLDVIRAYDRCVIERPNIPILNKIGRHNNDTCFSFYSVNPSGFGIEFGCDATVLDVENWCPSQWTHEGGWGHEPHENLKLIADKG